MKRQQLIELALIIVALIFLVNAVQALINLLITEMYRLTAFQDQYEFQWLYLLNIFLYCISYYILIRYKTQLSAFINGKESQEVRLPLRVNQLDLLHIVIIGISLSMMVKPIASVLRYAFQYFRFNVASYNRRMEMGSLEDKYALFKTDLVLLVLLFVMLILSRKLATSIIGSKNEDTFVVDNPGGIKEE